MPTYDITEGVPFDLTATVASNSLELNSTAYDIVINNIPFVANVTNQNPYRRETAPYKKDQFDNSPEPGEQAFTGWWLRSQTSWHNGAGIKFYEPGTDYQHVSHRFNDSRGIDVWTVGEATVLPEVIDVYTGTNLINAAAGRDGTSDVLVTGNSGGTLKKVSFDVDDGQATATPYTITSHTSYAFNSVTSDGSNYYATCSRGIHVGNINADSDVFAFKVSPNATPDPNTFIKYVKGYILFGAKNKIYNMELLSSTGYIHSAPSGPAASSLAHNASQIDTLPTTFKAHVNANWIWNDATASPGPIYLSGNGGNNGEVWQIKHDEVTNTLDMPGATMVISLPEGETINALHYYLGSLVLGTSSGARVCPVDINNNVVLGPLLFENSNYPVNGFTESNNYIYAATKAINEDGTNTHACLICIDLSNQFDDGTYAYAHDLEYRSSVNKIYLVSNKALTTNVATLTTTTAHDFNVGNSVTVTGVDATFNGTYVVASTPTTTTFTYAKTASNVTSTAVSPNGSVTETASNSEATEVYQVNNRLVMVVEETTGVAGSGELHIQSKLTKRDTGWLKTGTIRYGTVEPKFFRFINLECSTGDGDSITISTIDEDSVLTQLQTINGGLNNQDIFISTLQTKQRDIALKFTFTNVNNDTALPVLKAYQLKSVPAIRRQRLYQFPLSCYDREMDRFNTEFGYDGRAIDVLNSLEALEETGQFVTVTDYRTNETFDGVIEEVRFMNESSSDKNNSGFGGLLLVTVRKM